MDSKDRDHLIVLKVMRLTKPTLMVGQPLPALPLITPSGQETTVNLSKELELVEGFKNFSLGEMLTLPQTFGNIFLGETFSSYISVHNDSDQLCKDIQIKADLQTSSQRMTLLATTAANFPELKPDDSIDDVIHHEVKELGTHILVCAVNYTTLHGDKMYFRKFFKFQVLKPLDVKTKFHNADTDDVYLEAQIQNITPVPVFMENVTLDPSTEYTAINLHKHSEQSASDNKSNVFQRIDYMNPLDIRQYLYCLKPKPDISTRKLRNVTHVGKLDIVWKTNMGEKGRLQTSALQRLVPSTEDIHLKVEQVPQAVKTEEPFELVLKATNCSERTMEVDLLLDNTVESGVLWCGVSGQHLGCLKPGNSTSLTLPLVAISTGLLNIAGLKLTDTFLKRTYEYGELAQIFAYCA